jgi:hypothetical protein
MAHGHSGYFRLAGQSHVARGAWRPMVPAGHAQPALELAHATHVLGDVATEAAGGWSATRGCGARHGRWPEASSDSEQRGWHHGARDVGWRRRTQGWSTPGVRVDARAAAAAQ